MFDQSRVRLKSLKSNLKITSKAILLVSLSGIIIPERIQAQSINRYAARPVIPSYQNAKPYYGYANHGYQLRQNHVNRQVRQGYKYSYSQQPFANQVKVYPYKAQPYQRTPYRAPVPVEIYPRAGYAGYQAKPVQLRTLRALQQQGQHQNVVRQAEPANQNPVRLAAVPQGKKTVKSNGWGIPQKYLRKEVHYKSSKKPGTIIVDTKTKFLYYVLGNNRAIRYGIGVARNGFEWAGNHQVTRKAVWPDWRPPAEMRKREPELPAFMKGGPENPLGARAIYIGSTLYRIHGTNEPWTIGQKVSSGCIRMMNKDVIDLYKRVKKGAVVIVS